MDLSYEWNNDNREIKRWNSHRISMRLVCINMLMNWKTISASNKRYLGLFFFVFCFFFFRGTKPLIRSMSENIFVIILQRHTEKNKTVVRFSARSNIFWKSRPSCRVWRKNVCCDVLGSNMFLVLIFVHTLNTIKNKIFEKSWR